VAAVVGSISVDSDAVAAAADSFVDQFSVPAGSCTVVVDFAAAAAEDNSTAADNTARCEEKFLGYFEDIQTVVHYSVQIADLLEVEVEVEVEVGYLIEIARMHMLAAAHSALAMKDYQLGKLEQ